MPPAGVEADSNSDDVFGLSPDRQLDGVRHLLGFEEETHLTNKPTGGGPWAWVFFISFTASSQQQARLPTDAFGRGSQFFQGPVLNLPDALFADAQQMSNLSQTVGAVAG